MRQILTLAAVVFAVGFIVLGGEQAGATHVGTIVLVDGSDTTSDAGGCGNPLNPCNTIQAGINHATSGTDTVQVAAGTYPENLSLAKDLTLRGAQAGIDACGRSASETIVTPGSGPPALGLLVLFTGSANATIDGFTFSGGVSGIRSDTGPIDNLQILNNRIRGFGAFGGIFLDDNGINITVDQNEVDGTGTTGTGGMIHVDGSDNFDGFHLTNNCVQNGVSRTGVNFGTVSSFTSRNVDASTLGSRIPLFRGNVINNNGTGTNLGFGSWGQGPIIGNTFTNNDFDGLQGGPRDSLIDGNTFDRNGRSGLALTGFGGGTNPNRGAINNDVTNNCFARNGLTRSGEGIFFTSSQFPGTISTNQANRNNIHWERNGGPLRR